MLTTIIFPLPMLDCSVNIMDLISFAHNILHNLPAIAFYVYEMFDLLLAIYEIFMHMPIWSIVFI